jgi:DNA (cytosine-5)-methyltransferase 1
MKKFKVLNLYAGIGGNRKHWKNVEVTAVENNQEIADVYKELHPNDTVVVADASKYLAKKWREYDFIWASPSCQSHSRVRMMASKGGSYDAIMPDMNLWAEITFLQNFTKNTSVKFVVENVNPYYKPFIEPTAKIGRHLFWANFDIPTIEIKDGLTHNERGTSDKGYFDLRPYKMKHRKDQVIRNCVDPNVGDYVLKCAMVNQKNHIAQQRLF